VLVKWLPDSGGTARLPFIRAGIGCRFLVLGSGEAGIGEVFLAMHFVLISALTLL
jgi:hypothetical protein